MPELPEVEVVRRELSELLAGQPKIEKFEFKRKDLRDPIPIRQLSRFQGSKVLGVHRRAKYLLIETTAGGILSHLGMTGTWRVATEGDERLHDHIYLHFSGGLRLAFRDPRRFGIFETYEPLRPASSPRLRNLGPEPLSQEFTGESLWRSFRKKTAPIKTAVMDQKIVVGVGNIYASEALFLAKIKPQKKAERLTKVQAEVLVASIKRVLQESIDRGGSSISDFAGADGESGSYQDHHQVYDRKDQNCVVCQTKIRHRVMAGRSTYWCPCCQV
jgi:formamidopyrimidine-DNA glycosylase